MANRSKKGIRLRKRVVRRPRRPRVNKELGLPMTPVQTRMVRSTLTKETNIPSTANSGREAVWACWPINFSVFPQLASLVNKPLYWRVSSVQVAMEPAMSSSTQHCGVGLSSSGAFTNGDGFGNVFKLLRSCNYTRRSPVGGNVMVKWPICMPFILNDDAHKNTGLTACVIIAVTNTGVLTGQSWTEILLNVEYVVGA
uniref:P3 n=2 Tax=Fig umbra-like virus TaxID=2877436 RepID=A0A8K1HIV4_9TOMB|nr:P3 [Fig umbra-like virus]